MIDLREHHEPILRFLQSGLAEFRQQNPKASLGHAALYCCPRSGWVSLCLARSSQLQQNCPDFDFVEFALYEASSWSEEYEEADLFTVVTLDGERLEIHIEAEGDEALNRVFFEFLRQVLSAPEAAAAVRSTTCGKVRIGVQLLDSEFNEAWEPTAAQQGVAADRLSSARG